MKTLGFHLYRAWVFFGRLAHKAKGEEREKIEQLSQASDRDSEWDTVSGSKAEDSRSSEDSFWPEGWLKPALHRLNDDVLCYLANSILPPDDAAAFSLTCRAAYKATSGRRILQRLNKEPALYRARSLEHLELDFPKYVLCYECGKYHDRLLQGFFGLTPCDLNGIQLDYAPNFRRLYYRQIKELANHYRLGLRYKRNELYMIPQTPYFKRDMERKIAHAVHIRPKAINNAGNFELIFRRTSYVEYKHTSRKSRQEAIYATSCRSHHLWPGFKEEKLAREMLPLCYRCEMCGAERQFTISYLASKPGYAVIRSTMWESVGH
ncbi:hypothetical protein H112_01056 [Trichophyton rubrum D6]|uniref:F-box domain-containing protein n=2 Tax=Trichophyton TaxID=5550 RepID=A0A022WEI0_TRIRU|nr:hypothetical protein H100_01055 [Trichophyton rubrum MR850]EZF45939.1 hypothetical protein H102_01046 [Trichophyton rubrum CBS 100081]EZF56546.1 hypothetical protein H103_01054 [Trichophyton rubrum CBS 288.86]EZF67172.1 hypothetical protein H104_01039 [Trichophyton rubrum CBS 289.86]EZF77772.1 hypothetical protein H105_01056 [Trichophyton soudanense CBS 452.61]EZF88508.1 hypothetical protein H110_01055 [Trichophyton rubrum MR1448]EZG10362.1 hypothetical protein H106_00853 [Trichophyton rub